jgi:hypothetical protein
VYNLQFIANSFKICEFFAQFLFAEQSIIQLSITVTAQPARMSQTPLTAESTCSVARRRFQSRQI